MNSQDDAMEHARLELEKQNKELGIRLEGCANQLLHVSRVYQGLEQDLTVVGAWQIFCQCLEEVMRVKVIGKLHYEELLNRKS